MDDSTETAPPDGLQAADIPLWFISFARHVLRTCKKPGRYHIILDVPSKNKEPREIQISLHHTLRHSLLENVRQPRMMPDPPPTHTLNLPKKGEE